MPSYKAVSAVLDTLLSNGEQRAFIRANSAPAAATAAHAVVADSRLDAAILAEVADVEASLAVLEADGASPTEAHVDDLRVLWDLLVTELAGIAEDTQQVVDDTVGFSQSGVILMFDATAIATRSRLKQVVDKLLGGVQSGIGGLTP